MNSLKITVFAVFSIAFSLSTFAQSDVCEDGSCQTKKGILFIGWAYGESQSEFPDMFARGDATKNIDAWKETELVRPMQKKEGWFVINGKKGLVRPMQKNEGWFVFNGTTDLRFDFQGAIKLVVVISGSRTSEDDVHHYFNKLQLSDVPVIIVATHYAPPECDDSSSDECVSIFHRVYRFMNRNLMSVVVGPTYYRGPSYESAFIGVNEMIDRIDAKLGSSALSGSDTPAANAQRDLSLQSQMAALASIRPEKLEFLLGLVSKINSLSEKDQQTAADLIAQLAK